MPGSGCELASFPPEGTLMIRVITASEPNAITLTVDGELVGEYIEPVKASADEALREKRPVHLFLRDVSRIDGQGRVLLAKLATQGVQLRASGVYNAYLVEEIRRDLNGGHQ